MKANLRSMVLFIVLTLGISGYIGNRILVDSLDALGDNETVAVQSNTEFQLKILQSNLTLRRGEAGIIVIQGKPNTVYRIETTYSMQGRKFRVTQVRSTDISGEATFNWVVDNKTDFGTQSAVITGGGETLQINHTVVP